MKFFQNGVYQTFQVQDFNSKCCGQLCLYVLFQLNNNENFYNIILNTIFSNTMSIDKWFKEYGNNTTSNI